MARGGEEEKKGSGESDIFHPVYRMRGGTDTFYDVIVCTGQRRHNNNRREGDGIKESSVQENISIPFQREGKEARAERKDRGK